ncbi:hypothetical protein N7475_006520 [Penicillium sp. IBT 31633x]|nr:hypothetical protein N7475_006520 [Penicillium sp. IBT 31633x]
MQFTKSLMLLAAFATSTLAVPAGFERRQASDWTSTPASGSESKDGFGSSTASSGTGITYSGNVGNPYGSNIIQVSADQASSYKYVAQFQGQNTEEWIVAVFNKYGPDGQMTGWFGNAAQTFTLAPGETKYVAFDEDTNGGWAAASGSTIPTDGSGGYASTWGEFDVGSTTNSGWSGFDVSAIVPQNAGLYVAGMRICDAIGSVCSTITPNAATVDNAYTTAETDIGGIGANLGSGPVRLAVTIDYSG